MTNADTLVFGVDQGDNLKALRRLQRERRVVLVHAHTLEQSLKRVAKAGTRFALVSP